MQIRCDRKNDYNSSEVMRENMEECTLKLVTYGLQFVFLLFAMLYLVYLNMNEDFDLKKRQLGFYDAWDFHGRMSQMQ